MIELEEFSYLTIEQMAQRAVDSLNSNPTAHGPFRVFTLALISCRGMEGIPSDMKEKLPFALEKGIITQTEIDNAQKCYKDVYEPRREVGSVEYFGLHQADKKVLAHGVACGTLEHREIVESQEAYKRN